MFDREACVFVVVVVVSLLPVSFYFTKRAGTVPPRRVHRMSFLVSGNHLFSGNLAKGKVWLLDWLSCIHVDRRAVYSTVTMSLFRSERESCFACSSQYIILSFFSGE